MTKPDDGTHDLYLVFTGGTGALLDLDSYTFTGPGVGTGAGARTGALRPSASARTSTPARPPTAPRCRSGLQRHRRPALDVNATAPSPCAGSASAWT